VKALFKISLPILLLALPAKVLACSACYGAQVDTPMTEGMNWGIFTLLGVIVPVLGGFLAFFIYLIHKSETMAAKALPQTDSPKV
jgi:hypothetical protein